MKTTFISTLLNEEKTVSLLFDSLLQQTVMPNEVVIVDAGSTDTTVEILQKYKKVFEKKRIKFNFFVHKGDRGFGRNYAIKKSSHEYILCSDAGCKLDIHWAENLMVLFAHGAEVAGGYYYSFKDSDSVFQKCVGVYMSVMPDVFDERSFLPSSRSIGFTKNAWKLVGGYPENIVASEDLQFAQRLKMTEVKMLSTKKAHVYWAQKNSFIAVAKDFFNHAMGDAQVLYFRPQIFLLFGRYIILVLLINVNFLGIGFFGFGIIICLYIMWSIFKNYRYINHPLALFYLPLIQVIADFSVMLGTITGFSKRF